jgi:hypothetical protein
MAATRCSSFEALAGPEVAVGLADAVSEADDQIAERPDRNVAFSDPLSITISSTCGV